MMFYSNTLTHDIHICDKVRCSDWCVIFVCGVSGVSGVSCVSGVSGVSGVV